MKLNMGLKTQTSYNLKEPYGNKRSLLKESLSKEVY